MKWLERFFGVHDKEQERRTEQVSQYVHGKKNEYTKKMAKAHHLTKKIKRANMRSFKDAEKLEKIVSDVTAQIAIATGGRGGI